MPKPTPDELYQEFLSSEEGKEAFEEAREKMENGDFDGDEVDEFDAAYGVWQEMSSWAQEEHGLTEAELESAYEEACTEHIVGGLS